MTLASIASTALLGRSLWSYSMIHARILTGLDEYGNHCCMWFICAVAMPYLEDSISQFAILRHSRVFYPWLAWSSPGFPTQENPTLVSKYMYYHDQLDHVEC